MYYVMPLRWTTGIFKSQSLTSGMPPECKFGNGRKRRSGITASELWDRLMALLLPVLQMPRETLGKSITGTGWYLVRQQPIRRLLHQPCQCVLWVFLLPQIHFL